MTLAPGTKLGPYEILSPLGKGGMGEVYRVKDPRLNREVAVKVLPEDLLEGEERKARFEQEARLLASLNHPGIAAIYSFEEIPSSSSSSKRHILVMELLEGETLRDRLAAGPLPLRKAVDFGVQIAQALAAAHEKGIVHRDLKPENLFITADGRTKILDFGLARYTPHAGADDTRSPTLAKPTDPGVVLGTVGYMSPEQVRGKPVDARSDNFSFGAILYEMLAGQRAFQGDSPADTMSGILTKEPPDLAELNRSVPAALERLVRHCLEKSLEERFHSAHDLAFDLGVILIPSGATSPVAAARASRLGPVSRRAAAVVLAFAAGAAAVSVVRKAAPPAATFRQLTFQRGSVLSARFAPDGQTVVYGGSWEGRRPEVFASRPESPQSRSLSLPPAEVLSISRSGDLALMLSPISLPGYRRQGMLARVPLAGGAPRPLRDRIEGGDWAPDGESYAVVIPEGGGARLEYPLGRVLHVTSGWISHPRVSPDGRTVAFCDHPQLGDDGGDVAVAGPGAPKKVLAGEFASIQGLAFSPAGDEIWFTAAKDSGNKALHAVSPSGRLRLVLDVPGSLTLHDLDRRGRALVTRDLDRQTTMALAAGETRERDLSVLDFARAMGMSANGRAVLMDETGVGGGPGYSAYVRTTDGAPAVRLGDGSADDLAPDGGWAIVGKSLPRQLTAVPTGPGEPVVLTNDSINHGRGWWLTAPRSFVFSGNEPGRPSRLWVQDVGAAPRPLSGEGVVVHTCEVSPDRRTLATTAPGEEIVLRSIDGSEPAGLRGGEANERPSGWSDDGRFLYVIKPGLTSALDRLEIATGRREHIRDLSPADAAGLRSPIHRVLVRANGRAYAYVFSRTLSELYLVEGLR